MIIALRVLWSRIHQARRLLWALVAGAAGIGIVLLVKRARAREGLPVDPAPPALEVAVAQAQARISEANARAAVEIAVARTRSAETDKALKEVLADPDGPRRRRALVALAEQTRAAGPLLLLLAPLALILGGLAGAPGCAAARPAPSVTLPAPLPPLVDVDRLVPPPPADAEVLPPGIKRHADLPVDEGDCARLPPGILVDEVAYAAAIRDHAERGRLTEETRVLRQLREQERGEALEIERLYRAEVEKLERQIEAPPSLWQRLKFPAGFVAGAIVTGLGVYAGARAGR